ncbi:MAG: hypothetical protein ACM3SP_03445 [Chloroflexota bacterium]
MLAFPRLAGPFVANLFKSRARLKSRILPQVERLQVAHDRVHVGEAVEIDERLPPPAFGDRHLAAASIAR